MKYFFLILALLLPQSCRQSTDDASRSIIDGTWETACVVNLDRTSQKVRYTFLITNVVTRVQNQFSDTACSVPRGTVVHTGIFELAVRTEVSLYEIDLFFRDVYATPANEEGALAWNAQTFCGLTRWLPREDIEVTSYTDPNCGVFGTSQIEYRDLIQVDANSRLVFGSVISNLAPRPEAVDATNPLFIFNMLKTQ
ncbi:MAG: hypothetical protein V4655_10695 [Bdellovibrionota bacterium]